MSLNALSILALRLPRIIYFSCLMDRSCEATPETNSLVLEPAGQVFDVALGLVALDTLDSLLVR